jgi:hypothetical protein
MCRYTTLFHDDKIGYAVHCSECGKIQVGYGNLVFTFGMDDFESFSWWLHKIREDLHPGQGETLRNIVIPTPCEGMKLLLSRRELNDFNQMLEAADTELRSLQLIRLFDSNSTKK